jgi:hypothetical protein
MKITVEMDTTPEELRTFLGLPDVAPLQQEMLEKIQEKMRAGVEGFDPLTLLKPFLPENMQTLSTMQKKFWESMWQAPEVKK